MKKQIKIKIYKNCELITELFFSNKYKIFKFISMNEKYREYGTIGLYKFEDNDITFRSIQMPAMDYSNFRIFLPGYDSRFDNLNIYSELNREERDFLQSFLKNNKKIYL